MSTEVTSEIDWRSACEQLCAVTYKRKHVQAVLAACLYKIYKIRDVEVRIVEYESEERTWQATVTLSADGCTHADNLAAFLFSLQHPLWNRKMFEAVYIDVFGYATREEFA